MSAKSLNQKGLAPAILLILLVGALVAGIYAFNYARTNLKPKAYDPDAYDARNVSTPATKDSIVAANCRNGTMYEKCVDGRLFRVVDRIKTSFSDEQNKEITECVRKEEETPLSCAAYFCPDEGVEYCDPNVDGGKVIRKSRLGYENGQCVYDFKNTGKVCGGSDTRKTSNISGYGGLRPDMFCEPGSWSKSTCSLCNNAGTTYNPSGTDWGNYSTDPLGWCACAKAQADLRDGDAYTKVNYPGCSDAETVTSRADEPEMTYPTY